MSLSFKRDDAYKLLLRFRAAPGAVDGFINLSAADVYVTDVSRHQLLIGRTVGDSLTSTIYNFSHETYDELFDGLCALCSSAVPMIIHHVISSADDKIVSAFENSRLGVFKAWSQVEKTETAWTLTATVKYPID